MPKKKNLVTENLKINQQKEILYQDIEDELIILHMENENYLGLDKVGTRFWNILISSKTVKEAYNKILEEYEVEPDPLKKDLNNFINELIKNDLVSVSSV